MKNFIEEACCSFIIYCLPFVICAAIAGLITWVAVWGNTH